MPAKRKFKQTMLNRSMGSRTVSWPSQAMYEYIFHDVIASGHGTDRADGNSGSTLRQK